MGHTFLPVAFCTPGDSKERLLRSDLTENVHFVFVAAEDFAKLKARFGLLGEVHEISRSVIETGIGQKKPQVRPGLKFMSGQKVSYFSRSK